MNRKNITITALAAVLVVAMAAMAYAGPGYGKGQRGNSMNDIYSQLTPEKQAAVDSIFDKYQSKFSDLRDAMWAKQSTLQAMVNGGQADEKKITSLTKDISSLRKEMRDTRDEMRAELEKETGLVAFGGAGKGCARFQQSCGGGCPGNGQGGRY